MNHLSYAFVLILSVFASANNAQWAPLGAPATLSVQFMVAHQGKVFAGVERGLFVADRQDPTNTVLRPADPISTRLTTGASWGDLFVTGSNQGRVVVYEDVSTAQRRIDAHPTLQSISALAGIGNVLLVGSYDGVHRSTDTLQSAVLTSAALGFKAVNQLVVLGSKVYAATGEGLFVSADTGATWAKVATPRRKINDLARFQDTLFLATEVGLYASADEGATWLEPLWPSLPFSRVLVRGDRLFTITQAELWSKGTTRPWTEVRLPLSGEYLNVLTLGDTTWIASHWGISTSDKGGPWAASTSVYTPSPQNIQALTHDGNILLAGTDTRGAFVSMDRGRTWSMRSHAFHHGAVYGIQTNTMHQGVWFSSTLKGVYRSADSGLTWGLVSSGIAPEFSTYGFVAQGARLWVGTNKGLFSTDDSGDSWLPPPGLPVGRSVYDLAISRSGTLFAATDTGLQRSLPPYSTWSHVDIPEKGTARLSQIGDTLYAIGSSTGPWRSLDGGLAWKSVKSGLPGTYLQSVRPGTHAAVAVDGLGGLFVISHGDTAWRSFQGDFPEGGVGAMTLLDDTAYVWGSFRRLYRRALPTASTSVDPLRGQNPSRVAFEHDARERSLRIVDAASVARVVVRDAAGRTLLRAPAGTGWVSLARVPSGLCTVTIEFRDRRTKTATLLNR